MAWATKNFEIGGVVIELPQAMQMTQSFEPFGGVATHRMMSGTGVRQTNWTKLKTNINCEGFIPPGLAAVDWTQPVTVKCGTTRSITSTSNAIAIPAGRRSDTGYEPTAKALVDGNWVATPCNVAGNTATCTVVGGATAYMVEYYPQLNLFLEPPQQTYDRTNGRWSWTVSGEEI